MRPLGHTSKAHVKTTKRDMDLKLFRFAIGTKFEPMMRGCGLDPGNDPCDHMVYNIPMLTLNMGVF